jgi:hypothetical protein
MWAFNLTFCGKEQMMRTRIALTILALAALARTAELPSDWSYGQALEVADPRSVAMGGATSVIGSPFGFLANPALGVVGFDRVAGPALPDDKLRPAVGLACRLGLVSEQRTRTVYDNFNNAVGELAIADNFNADALPGPIAVCLPGKVVQLGVGLAPRYDYNYVFRQEFRDGFYQLTGRNDLQLSGQVMRTTVALAYDLFDVVGLGASMVYDFGERALRQRDSTTGDTWLTLASGRPSGLGWSAGLLLHPGRSFRMGVGFEPATRYTLWTGEESSSDPLRVKLGAAYFAAGRIPAELAGQVSYVDWHGVDSTLLAVLSIRAGVEHRLLNNVALRYGFGLLPSPRDATVQSGLASVGLGFDTGFAHFDLGASLQRRVFGSAFLSPTPEIDMRIYQTSGEVVLAISKAF